MIKEETKQTAEEAARGYSNDCRNRQRHCERTALLTLFLAHNGSQSNRLG